MINCLIIEDEYYAGQELKLMVEEIGKVKVLGICENALEALKEINRHHPDLLFLDIQLPMIDGFELLSMIEPGIMPKVIFTTAYDEYAIKAFEEDAVDYLLKPIDKERLIKAIDRMDSLLKVPDLTDSNIKLELKRIPSCVARKIKLIPIDEIEFINTDSTGTFAVCKNDKFYTDLTLKVIESRSSLIRCHKQYLFNLDKVIELELEENQTAKLVFQSGHKIPVSRSYLKNIKEILMY